MITRQLLSVAAAEPTGDPALLWRAAGRLGISRPALEPVESAGLIEVDSRVRFRHPLFRSAVYRAAAPEDRRRVHRALAETTDEQRDPDRRAWHLAEAAEGPDENAAAELGAPPARPGGVASHRRGVPAACSRADAGSCAAGGKRAGRRPDKPPGRRARPAERLAGDRGDGPLDDLQNARLHLVRAQLAFFLSRGKDASPLLLSAAKRLESLDVDFARETYLEAMAAAMFAGRLASPGGGTLDGARAAIAGPRPSQRPRVADLILDGLAALHTEGYSAGAPTLHRTLVGLLRAYPERTSSLAVAGGAFRPYTCGMRALGVLSKRHVFLAREAGALSELPLALSSRIFVHLFTGELGIARALVEELNSVTEVIGSDLAPYGAIGLAAFEGLEERAQALLDVTNADARRRGQGVGISVTQWATALLGTDPGLGRYEEALSAAPAGERLPRRPRHVELGNGRADRGRSPKRDA